MKHYVTSLGIAFCVFCFIYIYAEPMSLPKRVESEAPTQTEAKVTLQSPPCVELYNTIDKYSDEYGIPKNIAFGIAFSETRYSGPLQWEYNHNRQSSAGALGPMQVMYTTAQGLFPGKKFTKNDLSTDIDFNVHCSMKLMRKLYDKYGNWKIALGTYNTGRPCVNGYAEKVYNYKL